MAEKRHGSLAEHGGKMPKLDIQPGSDRAAISARSSGSHESMSTSSCPSVESLPKSSSDGEEVNPPEGNIPTVKLQSSDGVVFDVDTEVAAMLGTIRDLLKNARSDEAMDEVVPLFKVHSTILSKVLEWAAHHRHDPPTPEEDKETEDWMGPTMGERFEDCVSLWDETFLNVDQPTFFGIMEAANYLNVQGLLNTTCKVFAAMIAGKTPQHIRNLFNIPCDFTRAQEERNRVENAWCDLSTVCSTRGF